MLTASIAYKEAIAQKWLHLFFLLATLLALGTLYFIPFNFGTSELKFISDYGLGLIIIFGTLLSVIVPLQLFFNEIENHTIEVLFTKPATRAEFMGGKFLGSFSVLLTFTGGMALLLFSILFLRETVIEEGFQTVSDWDYGKLLLHVLFQVYRFGILCALTLFVASFAHSSNYTIAMTFLIILISQLQFLLHSHLKLISPGIFKHFVSSVSLLFPDLQLYFNPPGTIDWNTLWGLSLYTLLYVIFFNALAILSIRNREF